MCGIAGFYGNQPLPDIALQSTLKIMINRGPDFQNFEALRHENTYSYLLHSRLSILDLDPRSHQPFRRGNLVLSFNGEIYNYEALRKKLEREGAQFRTPSDTEVLIAAYETYGMACLNELEGMFAFAVFDKPTGELVLVRNVFGDKPLYVLKRPEGPYF